MRLQMNVLKEQCERGLRWNEWHEQCGLIEAEDNSKAGLRIWFSSGMTSKRVGFERNELLGKVPI
jgi:hypothetical protein